jgi:hypothetical protein
MRGPARTFKVTSAVDGAKQWMIVDGKASHFGAAGVAEERERIHADWVMSLRPLRSPSLHFKLLDETRVGGRPAVGVEVTSKGHRAVRLFFDRERGLLLKSETRLKDVASDKEVAHEEFYSDYREVQGVQLPMHVETRRDGRRYSESRRSDVKLLEKLDDKLFNEPSRKRPPTPDSGGQSP